MECRRAGKADGSKKNTSDSTFRALLPFQRESQHAPHFSEGSPSIFVDFINGAKERLERCFTELKRVSETDIIGEEIKYKFSDQSINISDPLSSTMPLVDIMKVIRSSQGLTSDRSQLKELLSSQEEFAHWVSSHQIHVLLGALRVSSHPSSFLFSVCDMDFESWNDFAADSSLFGAILKAVWLRCIRGTTYFSVVGKTDEDHKSMRREIIDGTNLAAGGGAQLQGTLEEFTEFFTERHFKPVLLFLSPAVPLFSHFAPYLTGLWG